MRDSKNEMTILVAIVIGVGVGVCTVSVWAIKTVSKRPANGELMQLKNLDLKIARNQEYMRQLLRHLNLNHL